MENYKSFLSRHGEHEIQAFLETWERYEGVYYTAPLPLEQRWSLFIHATSSRRPATPKTAIKLAAAA